MYAFHAIDEKFTSDYYINVAKMYEHYTDETKYFATVTSLDNLEEIECVDCNSEHEAMSAYHTLIDQYVRGL